ncbi:hypothetical protein HM1_1294 [Heliomicrobium modesticaldum Ice1]|uniref:Uncharacterized protein n=1 Tax=Heliobacterium modesticaldum (strain ATCC 51547 / Ice1) TaxID=498761 RepID=B0TGM2_HELMI|nr:hypothetical protein HM1_1294 [Heliomicrobium modesticaldum Ice1]
MSFEPAKSPILSVEGSRWGSFFSVIAMLAGTRHSAEQGKRWYAAAA